MGATHTTDAFCVNTNYINYLRKNEEISHKHSNTPLLAPHRGHYSTPARAMRTCRNVSDGNPCDPGSGPLRGSGGGYVGDAPNLHRDRALGPATAPAAL